MPHHPPLPKAPHPTREIFDPFNSSSTGHQRAENRLSGSTSWRHSRSHKLAHQFRDPSGRGGSEHLSDLVGAGSVNWKQDGRKENGDWEKGASGLREEGWQDIRGLMSGSRKRASEDPDGADTTDKKRKFDSSTNVDSGAITAVPKNSDVGQSKNSASIDSEKADMPNPEQPPQIFRGLTIFLNGSTAPQVSDHKLKQIFMQHGGNSSINLGRRTVTHVFLGKTCGGGLASGKINKEVTTIRGKGIKYVTVQWVLDSVEKGIRQPESLYAPPAIARRIGGGGQNSVRSIFGTKLEADKG